MLKERNYGIDLLRIISMSMIVMLHVLGHGGVLNASAQNTVGYGVAWFLESAAYCAVNCYALISGYVGYGTKHKYSNIVVLYLQVVFWTIAIQAVFMVVMPGTVGITDIVKSLFVFALNTYWYFTAYFCMFFFIPFLNRLIQSMEKKEARILLVTIIFVFSVLPTVFQNDMFKNSYGSSAFWLVMLYLIGAYFKKYEAESTDTKIRDAVLYLLCIVVTWISQYGVELLKGEPLGESTWNSPMVTYVSPTILLSAIALLLFFRRIHINRVTKKLIGFFAPVTFGVYLIHEQPLVRQYLVSDKFARYGSYSPALLVLSVIGTVFCIWLVCSLLDAIRLYLFKVLKIKTLCSSIIQITEHGVKSLRKRYNRDERTNKQ